MAHRPERELTRPPTGLRSATAADAAALTDILRRASLANPGDRDWLLAHPEVLVIDPALLHGGRIVVAERAGKGLGFACVLPPEQGEAEIDGIFVCPSHWRQGIAAALLRCCAGRARAEGATQLRVVVNLHALGFYLAQGFETAADDNPAVAAGLACAMRRAA